MLANSIFFLKNVILELCTGVHCADLDESFQTHIFLQNFASIQPRTSPLEMLMSTVPGPVGGGRERQHDLRPGHREQPRDKEDGSRRLSAAGLRISHESNIRPNVGQVLKT